MTEGQAQWLRKLLCRVFGHKFWEDRWNGAVMTDHCSLCGITPAALAAHEQGEGEG